MKRNEIVQQALTRVYTDYEKYVRDIAREHTIANLGGMLEDAVYPRSSGEHLIADAYQQCLENHAEALGEVEGCDAVEGEYRDWLENSRRDAAKVRRAGLPLTIENARFAFEKKGPFARAK